MQNSRQRFVGMLKDAILSLCRNGLLDDAIISVEGLLAITLVNEQVVVVNIQEQLRPQKDNNTASVDKSQAVEVLATTSTNPAPFLHSPNNHNDYNCELFCPQSHKIDRTLTKDHPKKKENQSKQFQFYPVKLEEERDVSEGLDAIDAESNISTIVLKHELVDEISLSSSESANKQVNIC